MSEKLPYNTHRKHRYYTQDHPLSAAQRRRVRRLSRIRSANNRDASFGKINWSAYEHQQLWDMIHSSDPATMGTAAHRWAQLAVGVDSATAEVHKTVQKLLMSWRGPSAVRAAESASKLTAWGAGASATMRDVGDGLDTYTSALLEARNTMPEPVYYSDVRHFREGYDVKASNGPSAAILADQLLDDHLPTKHQETTAKAEAVRVMERYESASKHVHDRLPHFTDAPEVVVGGGDGLGGGGDTVASSVPGGGAGGGAGGGFGAGAAMPDDAGGGSGYAGNSVLGRGSVTGGAETSGGAPGAPAAAGAGGGAAASARGAGPVGGAGMYPPGAAGQRGQGDGEHQNRYSEGLGLDFLDDLPSAYPPVLGE
jgi:PPE family protein